MDHRQPPEAYVAFAHRLADAAGAIQKRYFRKPIAIDAKADHSPVTIADREAEAVMRELISRQFPAHGIYGEEHGVTAADAEWVWCLDPIDGTKAFITGRPTFGTLIALLHHGRPVLGVIDQVINKERWLGVAGRPSTLNGTRIGTRACAELAEATLFCTNPRMFAPGLEMEAFERVVSRVKLGVWGGDCYAYALLAMGLGDLMVEADLEPYDFMALVPVLEGAGGRMTDWQGRPLGLETDGRVVAVGDQRLLQPVLALLLAS